ncbi:MAG TPA: hypothetical protein PLE25_08025 [Spirochaetales bacterium]|nr:hypothetical protein [Spirochaetales bacterium]
MSIRRTTIARAIMIATALISVACDWEIGTDLPNTVTSGGATGRRTTLIDHRSATIDGLSDAELAAARALRVAYWHTSHGSQLVTGNDGMDAFYGGRGRFVLGGQDGLALDEQGTDIGNPGLEDFDASVRAYLADHADTDVVMASWCGQVSGASEAMIDRYLEIMEALEAEFGSVDFVYMTGHADGSGLSGNLHIRNQQVREHCVANGSWLYDFYDIECYDPDGTYYGDRNVDDACGYDGGNWARAWQDAHPGQWWECSSAHSEPLNANQKAKAAWRLWALLAAARS